MLPDDNVRAGSRRSAQVKEAPRPASPRGAGRSCASRDGDFVIAEEGVLVYIVHFLTTQLTGEERKAPIPSFAAWPPGPVASNRSWNRGATT